MYSGLEILWKSLYLAYVRLIFSNTCLTLLLRIHEGFFMFRICDVVLFLILTVVWMYNHSEFTECALTSCIHL